MRKFAFLTTWPFSYMCLEKGHVLRNVIFCIQRQIKNFTQDKSRIFFQKPDFFSHFHLFFTLILYIRRSTNLSRVVIKVLMVIKVIKIPLGTFKYLKYPEVPLSTLKYLKYLKYPKVPLSSLNYPKVP